MTEQFKQTLFDYLTGKLDIQQGTNEEIFKEINMLPTSDWPRSDWTEDRDILPNYWLNFRYEGLIQVKNSELLVLYGGYKNGKEEIRGIITLLDNKFKPIKSFYKYDSGTYLQYIMCMIQEDDGTFTMTTCPDYPRDEEWSFTSSTKKFIMVNNFTQQVNNDYVLMMNKSYNLPSTYSNFYCRKIHKNPNSSNYVCIGQYLRDQNSPNYDGIRIINLKVNVGSENEWNKWDDNNQGWFLGDSYVEFQDDNFFCEILLTRNLLSNRNISLWIKDFSQSSFSLKTIGSVNYYAVIDASYYENQSVFLNKNEIYFVLNNQRWAIVGQQDKKYIGLYYYNMQNEEFKTIYEHYLGDYDYCNLEAIYIVSCNNKLYIEFNNNINATNRTSDYYFQRLENNQWDPIKVSENQFFRYSTRALYVSNQFNLLNCLSYMTNPQNQYWYLLNILENYSESKYNGQPYINANALIANNAELYSHNSLVFARNLYNKSLNNNTTVATVEVPNNYLNDIDITSKNLLSETNLTMIADTNMTQKNIYETLYINFINTLLIADRNNDTQVLNQQASTYLNTQINDSEGYSKAQIYPKVVITYQDNSTKETAFEYQNTEDTSADIVFALYVDQLMQSAEIVSNDKSTVYQTINLTNLEQDKYYVIRQNLKII